MNYIPDPPNIYQGKQVLINSDRLLFNAKEDSILLFSNRAIGFSTNGSFNFDTSNNKESKLVINTPKIYLGIDHSTGNLPTEPAVLGNELEIILNEILTLIDDILDDISTKVSYVTSAPGSPTAPNPTNFDYLAIRRFEIENIRGSIEDIKSKKTNLI